MLSQRIHYSQDSSQHTGVQYQPTRWMAPQFDMWVDFQAMMYGFKNTTSRVAAFRDPATLGCAPSV
jgi:hypothetical protein